MVVGIGVDAVKIERVAKACEKEHFLRRIFTQREIEQMDSKKRRAASDFCGKEAVVKMFGTGFLGIDAIEVEIMRHETGEPFVVLYGKAKKYAEEKRIDKILISITNTETDATAFVTGIRKEG